MNGRVHGELKDATLSSRELINQRLGLLDGVTRYSLSLWKLPEEVPFDRVDLSRWPQEYIQAAGSVQGMTVEVRRLENQQRAQYVVGRNGPEVPHEPIDVAIPWNGYVAHVSASEVFSKAEAVDAFALYWETGALSDAFRLRRILV